MNVRDLIADLEVTDNSEARQALLGIYVSSLSDADTSHLDGIEFDPAALDDIELVDGFYGIRDYLADLEVTDETDTDARASLMSAYIRSLRVEANARPLTDAVAA